MSKKEAVTLKISGIAKQSIEKEDVLDIDGEIVNIEEFKEALAEDVKQLVLHGTFPSAMLKELLSKASEGLNGENDERVHALAVRLNEALKDIEDLARGLAELKTFIRGKDTTSRETAGQMGIVLAPTKEHKKPTIDFSNLRLKDFLPRKKEEK